MQTFQYAEGIPSWSTNPYLESLTCWISEKKAKPIRVHVLGAWFLQFAKEKVNLSQWGLALKNCSKDDTIISMFSNYIAFKSVKNQFCQKIESGFKNLGGIGILKF